MLGSPEQGSVFVYTFGEERLRTVSVMELAGPAAYHPQPSLTSVSLPSGW